VCSSPTSAAEYLRHRPGCCQEAAAWKFFHPQSFATFRAGPNILFNGVTGAPRGS
jgi:hypothetical protein